MAWCHKWSHNATKFNSNLTVEHRNDLFDIHNSKAKKRKTIVITDKVYRETMVRSFNEKRSKYYLHNITNGYIYHDHPDEIYNFFAKCTRSKQFLVMMTAPSVIMVDYETIKEKN